MIQITKKSIAAISFLLLFSYACIEPFAPPEANGGENFLVVDGFLNTTSGDATIVLKHSVPLNSDQPPSPEIDAIVHLKVDGGEIYTLPEEAPGRYRLKALSYDIEKEYRVYIKTKSNKEYESAPIRLKETPPIDSVTWAIEDDQLNIYVSTHDAQNESRYYKWNAIETYKYHSEFVSSLIVENNQIVDRNNANQIYHCWKTAPIYFTTIATTAQLAEDVVNRKRIIGIDAGSLRISDRYSLFIQQQTLTADAYQYWNEVQKTTEELGTLFDPLPGQVIGNITCLSNPAETVIGFISGGSVSETRIYIDASELPRSMTFNPTECFADTVPVQNGLSVGRDGLIAQVYEGITLVGYLTSESKCIDCRVLGGGATSPPDFWIE